MKEHNELCFLTVILTHVTHPVEHGVQTVNIRNMKLRGKFSDIGISTEILMKQ